MGKFGLRKAETVSEAEGTLRERNEMVHFLYGRSVTTRI